MFTHTLLDLSQGRVKDYLQSDFDVVQEIYRKSRKFEDNYWKHIDE